MALGGSLDMKVDSWPPPWEAVDVNNETALPWSVPLAQRPPVASQKALKAAGGEPYLLNVININAQALEIILQKYFI